MSINLRSMFLICIALLVGIWYSIESYRDHQRFDYKILGENTILVLDRREQLFKLITSSGVETKRLTKKSKSNKNFFSSLIEKKSKNNEDEYDENYE